MLKLFAGLALACVATPAIADDCSGQAKRLIIAAGQHNSPILADFKVKGAPYDREIIVGYRDGLESVWFFAKGCLASRPVLLGPGIGAEEEPPTIPDDAPETTIHGNDSGLPAKPSPSGGGAEIGI